MDTRGILLFMHVAGVVVWVGGMFFAYMCLRPVAAQQLQPPQRLPLWSAVFARFFPWVWGAVALILSSGLTTLWRVGFARAPMHWHVMLVLGLAMTLIFCWVFFGPYPRLRRGVAESQWPAAGAALNQIRQLVGVNLLLGLVTIATATLGWLIV